MPNLFIDVEARFAKFQDSLDTLNRKADKAFGGMEKSAQRLGASFAALGVGLSVAGLAAFAKSAVDSVAALDDLSEKTSLTVETLASLREVAIIGGHSLDDVAGGASKFAKSVSAAAGGSKEMLQLFQQLGISAADLKNQSFDQIFVRFATVIATATDKTNALAIAQKLAGKGAAENLPFFNDLAERGLQATKVTAQMAAEAERVQKNFKELALRSQDTRDAIVGRMLPALIALTEEFRKAVVEGDNLLVVLAKTFSTAFGGNAQLQQDRAFIDNVNKKLRLERQIGDIEAGNDKSLSARSPGKLKALKADLAATEERIAALQRERSERDKPATAKPPGRTVGPVADLGALEKARREAEAAAKALEDLVESRSKIAVDAEQSGAKNRLAILDHFYKEGFADEERYWQVRAEIQRAAYEVERRALDANVASRQAAADKISLDPARKKTKDYYDALKDLEEAQAKRNKLDADFNAQGTQDVLARSKATQDYENAIKGVNAQLEELKGNSAEAARIRGELQQERLLNDARNRNDLEGEIAVVNLQKATEAQARFNELRERAEQVTARLALEEERIQNALRIGAINDWEAARRTDVARRNALQTLGLTKEQLDELANTTGFEKLRLEAERFGVQLETLAAQSNLVNDKARELFEGAVIDGWRTFREELQKSGKVLDSLGKGFLRFAQTVIDKIADIQAANLAKALLGESGTTGGGSGVTGGLVGLIAKLFTGDGSTIDTGGIIIDQVDFGPGYAVGTQFVPRTGLALVHEGEQIIPASQVGARMSRENIVVHQAFNISGPMDRRSQSQIAAAASDGLLRARNRNR